MTSALRRYRSHAVVFALGLTLGVAAYARIGSGAASIDAGVQAALLLVISVTLAATAGAAGAVLGASIAADAARESARVAKEVADDDRDDSRQARADDRADARLDRFADRKLSLAVDLLLAADLHRDQADQQVAAKDSRFQAFFSGGAINFEGTIPDVGQSQPVRAAWLALQLVAPGVEKEARALYEATTPLGRLAAAWVDPTEGDTDPWDAEWDAARQVWEVARLDFVQAVRADLEVGPHAAA